MEVLVVAPRDDRASRQSGRWADLLAQRFPASIATSAADSRPEVDELLDGHLHLLYFGHGEADALVTRGRLLRARRVLVDEVNLATASGRIAIAVACWSGDGLARTVTNPLLAQPVTSYIGWLDEVSWPSEWPDPIGEAVVEGLAILLEGGTVGDCATEMAAAFGRAHDRYRSANRVSAEAVKLGKWCSEYWKGRMVVEGDSAATL